MNAQKPKNILLINALTLLFLIIPLTAFAFTINYQASLTDNDKVPINGKINMQFSIYNTETEGEPLWTESRNDVSVTNGIFSIILGENNDIPESIVKENVTLFLGIRVGDDAEMIPRSQLFDVPGSIKAKYAISSETVVPYGITTESIADGAVTNDKIADNSVDGEKIAPQTITPDKLTEKYPPYDTKGNLPLDGAIQIGSTDDCDCSSEKVGTLRYNETQKTMEYCNGIEWHTLYHGPNISNGLLPPGDAEIIIGPDRVCMGHSYNYISGKIFSASQYLWTVPADATITNGLGSKEIVIKFGYEPGNICVAGENDNGTGAQKCITVEMNTTGSQVFEFQTSYQIFIVPQCVNSIYVKLYGAQGESTGGEGGYGGYVYGQIDVTPGQVLYIFIGGEGNPWNGGGVPGNGGYETQFRGGWGGGSTDIRIGGKELNNRIVVAGGGGGSGGCANSDCSKKGGGGGSGGISLCEEINNEILGHDGYSYSGGGGGGCNSVPIYQRQFYYGGSGGLSYIKGLTNAKYYPGYNKGDGKVIISW